MGNDIVQAKYDELEMIANRFKSRAEANGELKSKVIQSYQALEQGGWIGRGAESFFKEMTGEMFPALERLSEALDEAQSVTLELKQIVEQAEEEAASVFQGNGTGGGGTPSPGAAGASSLPELVETPPGTFDSRRAPYTIGQPQEVSNHSFYSGAADALKYDVQVGGKTISIFMPKNPDPAQGNFHSVEEIAKGLAALPEQSRDLVTHVNVEPGKNPDDSHWAVEYNDPNFESYMTAGGDGVVNVYPSSNPIGQDYLDGTMVHETGHIWSQQKWGDPDSDARWNDWKAAIQSDPSAASKYAQVAPAEDFSETLLLYHQVKGTPEEAAARQKMPERFKIIDEIVAGKR